MASAYWCTGWIMSRCRLRRMDHTCLGLSGGFNRKAPLFQDTEGRCVGSVLSMACFSGRFSLTARGQPRNDRADRRRVAGSRRSAGRRAIGNGSHGDRHVSGNRRPRQPPPGVCIRYRHLRTCRYSNEYPYGAGAMPYLTLRPATRQPNTSIRDWNRMTDAAQAPHSLDLRVFLLLSGTRHG